MIDVSALPAVRARVETAELTKDAPAPDDVSASVPACYPSKQLVLENGRYLVAEPTK